MAVPTTRDEFKEFCLRSLGKGVIQINVSDAQAEDRIDEALNFWYDFHYDGTERVFFKHQVTQTDKDNGYITLADNIRGAVKIFNLGTSSASGGSSMFNTQYQFYLANAHNLPTGNLANYYMSMQNIALMEEIFVGMQPIRYTRYVDKLYIDMNWDKIAVGEYLCVEVYQIVDPETYTDAFNDLMLQQYATCLIKLQWGNNMKKYVGTPLLGGTQMDGQTIYAEAFQEKLELERKMQETYNVPAFDMIG